MNSETMKVGVVVGRKNLVEEVVAGTGTAPAFVVVVEDAYAEQQEEVVVVVVEDAEILKGHNVADLRMHTHYDENLSLAAFDCSSEDMKKKDRMAKTHHRHCNPNSEGTGFLVVVAVDAAVLVKVVVAAAVAVLEVDLVVDQTTIVEDMAQMMPCPIIINSSNMKLDFQFPILSSLDTLSETS